MHRVRVCVRVSRLYFSQVAGRGPFENQPCGKVVNSMLGFLRQLRTETNGLGPGQEEGSKQVRLKEVSIQAVLSNRALTDCTMKKVVEAPQ